MDSRRMRVPAEHLQRGPGAHDVHTAHWRAPAADPDGLTVVCVHGLGGSHLNWRLVGPLLAALPGVAEVWAPDLAGFGLTPLAAASGEERLATLHDNRDLLRGFLRTVAPGRPVVLLGNSMGGLIALQTAALDGDLVAGVAVVNPALPAPLGARLDPQVVANFAAFALPRVGERVLARRQRRLTPLEQVEQTMGICAARPDALDRELLQAHADLAALRREMPYAHRAFLQAARDVVRAVTVGRARVWDAVARIRAPGLYLQGALDRLIRPETGALLLRHRPDWDHVRYDDLGHIPMVEDSVRVAADIQHWLRTRVARAAAS